MDKFANTAEFSHETVHWLDWQCRMISDVKHGAVFLTTKTAGSHLQPVTFWPDDSSLSSALEVIAAKTIEDAVGIVKKEVNDKSQVFDYVSYQLIQDDCVVGAVVLALSVRSDQQCQAVLQLLQWGTVFMEKILERGESKHLDGAVLALSAVALLAGNEPLAVAGYHLCNLLAERFDCSRVQLGLRRGLQVRVISMSHQLQFDRRIEHIRQIEFAMEECLEQNKKIILPATSQQADGVIDTHNQQLLDDNNGSVCSIPLRYGEFLIGVLTLICEKKNHFDDATVKLLTTIADNIAPVITINITNDRPIWKKVVHALNTNMQRLIGSGYFRVKFISLCSIVALGLLTQLQTDHLISAHATVEGTIQQAIVAPFRSYIANANARAGDRVNKGQILITLDDRELLLEHEKWESERAKHAKEYQQALALGDRANISMQTARIAQSDAQLHRIEEQLSHTKLLAPFTGLLVSGDWNRALGSPIERGQLLFEVVPAKNYRVTLQVDELDLVGLNTGQNGNLRLTGLPEQSIDVRVSRIMSIASAKQGHNNFRVESEIVNPPQELRPGMQGIAKIVIGRDSLLKVWTYPLLNRLRLWAWSMGF